MFTAGIPVKPDVAVALPAKNLTLFLVNESGLPESKSEVILQNWTVLVFSEPIASEPLEC